MGLIIFLQIAAAHEQVVAIVAAAGRIIVKGHYFREMRVW